MEGKGLNILLAGGSICLFTLFHLFVVCMYAIRVDRAFERFEVDKQIRMWFADIAALIAVLIIWTLPFIASLFVLMFWLGMILKAT